MIREATVFDIPAILDLGELLNENFRNIYNLNEMLNDGYSKVIVYESDDKIIGFITATVLYDTCDILSLIVDPEYRKQKVASNLLGYLIGELDYNCKLITLEVKSHNTPAVNLYKKFGFELIHVREKYYKDDDAYLMARKSEK